MNKVYNISTSQVATAKLDLHALMPQYIPDDDTIRMWLSKICLTKLSTLINFTALLYHLSVAVLCCRFPL